MIVGGWFSGLRSFNFYPEVNGIFISVYSTQEWWQQKVDIQVNFFPVTCPNSSKHNDIIAGAGPDLYMLIC